MFKIFSTLEIFLSLGVLKHVKFPPRFFFPVFIVVWQHQTFLVVLSFLNIFILPFCLVAWTVLKTVSFKLSNSKTALKAKLDFATAMP